MTIPGIPTDVVRTSDFTWASLANKPLVFPPSAHSHVAADLPASIAYKDQANTFSANQTINGDVTANGSVLGRSLFATLGDVNTQGGYSYGMRSAGFAWFHAAEANLRAISTGAFGNARAQIEANGGLAIRNLASSADAPLTCGNLTASGFTRTQIVEITGNQSWINFNGANYFGGTTYFRSSAGGSVNATLDGATGALTAGAITASGNLNFTGANPKIIFPSFGSTNTTDVATIDGGANRYFLEFKTGGNGSAMLQGNGAFIVGGLMNLTTTTIRSAFDSASPNLVWGLNKLSITNTNGSEFRDLEVRAITASGPLSVRNSVDTYNSLIAQFLTQNLSAGVGVDYRGVRAIGSNTNNDLLLDALGTGVVRIASQSTGGLAVTGAITASGGATITGITVLKTNSGTSSDGLVIQNTGGTQLGYFTNIYGSSKLYAATVAITDDDSAWTSTSLKLKTTSIFGFVSGTYGGLDTTLSRNSAGVWQAGLGATANASGSLLLTNLTASGVLRFFTAGITQTSFYIDAGNNLRVDDYQGTKIARFKTNNIGRGGLCVNASLMFDVRNQDSPDCGMASPSSATVEIHDGRQIAAGGSYGSMNLLNLTSTGTIGFTQGRFQQPSSQVLQTQVYDTTLLAWQETERSQASPSGAKWSVLGATPIVKQTLPAAATDAATTQSLCNAIRSLLVNFGFSN